MKKVIFSAFVLFVCISLLAGCAEKNNPADEASGKTSGAEVSNTLSDNSVVSDETDVSDETENASDVTEPDNGGENSAPVEDPDDTEPVLLDVRTEEGDKKTVYYQEYDNGNILEKIVIYEDDEKKVPKTETFEKDGEILSLTEYINGEVSKCTYFIDGEMVFYRETFKVSQEESVHFGETGTHTYDASKRLLKSHYGKSEVYYPENGEIYYLCYDDPGDPWNMWLYEGFTAFYQPQKLIAAYLADETGWYLSVETPGEGYTEQQAETVIKKVDEYRREIFELSERWQSYVNESNNE